MQGASSLAVRSAASKHPALQKQVVSVLGSPKAKASTQEPPLQEAWRAHDMQMMSHLH